MPDSRAVCVDVLDAIGFGVAWWVAALLTLSEPVSNALLVCLALPSAKVRDCACNCLICRWLHWIMAHVVCHPQADAQEQEWLQEASAHFFLSRTFLVDR